MKSFLLFLISIYQKVVSPTLKQLFGVRSYCRFYPTCSEYGKNAVEEHGVLGGGRLVLKRILLCQPFSKRPAINL